MKILLFGKNGQLGNALLTLAPTFSFEIRAFDQGDVDIRDMARVESMVQQEKPDAVINAAAYHVVPECEKNPGLAMAVNGEAVMNMAKQCKAVRIPFFTYSTDYVFDGKKGTPYEEADPPHPLNGYGISKLAGEVAALQAYPEGTFVIRTCGVYGGKTGSPTKKGNFVLNILKEGREKSSVEVTDQETVSPTFADDLARASLQLLSQWFHEGSAKVEAGIYHLVNEGYCTWYEFAKEIFRVAGVKTPLMPRKMGSLKNTFSRVNGDKLAQHFVESSSAGSTKCLRSASSKNSRKGIFQTTHDSVGTVVRPAFSALKNKKAAALGIVLPSWQDSVKRYLQYLSL